MHLRARWKFFKESLLHGFKLPSGVEVAIFEILTILFFFLMQFLPYQCYRFTSMLIICCQMCFFSRKMKGFCYMNIRICILAWRSNNWYNFFFFWEIVCYPWKFKGFWIDIENFLFFLSLPLSFAAVPELI